MAMRDLIPWSRQPERATALYRDEDRSPFPSLRREMDRLFDDFFRAPVLGTGRAGALVWPSLEVKETDGEVRVTAELPGMSDKDIELTVEDGMLTLRGEKKSEQDERDRGWSERFYGRFERRIGLPGSVDDEACQAEFRDGVLTVTMKKSPERERGRRISINGQTGH
jgi:HSP20 family protein